MVPARKKCLSTAFTLVNCKYKRISSKCDQIENKINYCYDEKDIKWEAHMNQFSISTNCILC